MQCTKGRAKKDKENYRAEGHMEKNYNPFNPEVLAI